MDLRAARRGRQPCGPPPARPRPVAGDRVPPGAQLRRLCAAVAGLRARRADPCADQLRAARRRTALHRRAVRPCAVWIRTWPAMCRRLVRRWAASRRARCLAATRADVLSWAQAAGNDAAPAIAVREDDVAQLLYTSGTTAAPKGRDDDHRALLAEYTSTLIACDIARRRPFAGGAAAPPLCDACLPSCRSCSSAPPRCCCKARSPSCASRSSRARAGDVLSPADGVDRPAASSSFDPARLPRCARPTTATDHYRCR